MELEINEDRDSIIELAFLFPTKCEYGWVYMKCTD